MKKVLIVILFTLILTVAIVAPEWPPDVHAIDITITIPADKVDRIKAGFLETYKKECKTQDAQGNCLTTYTDTEWVKEILRRTVVSAARQGERALAKETAVDNLVNDLDDNVQ